MSGGLRHSVALCSDGTEDEPGSKEEAGRVHLHLIRKLKKEKMISADEQLDWREINPKIHTWEKGLAEFKDIHKKIVELLNQKDDKFLREIVDYRKYNFRFLLNGLIQHNIYHIGQVAYVKKLLE